MKYIKEYENIIGPKVGDYVLMRTKQPDLEDYISTHIGQITDIDRSTLNVRYDNVPPEILANSIHNELGVRTFTRGLIVDYAPTKEKLELQIQSNKYNL